MKHYQSGIEWRTGAVNQLQHRGNKWFLITCQNGNTNETPVSKKIAKSLLAGGMSYGS